jgi:Ran GTPase-activating protein (RanGAP) involved in mRNA processing and transport
VLDLANNEIGAEGAKAVAELLRHKPITSLDLNMNEMGDTGMAELAKALKARAPSVVS